MAVIVLIPAEEGIKLLLSGQEVLRVHRLDLEEGDEAKGNLAIEAVKLSDQLLIDVPLDIVLRGPFRELPVNNQSPIKVQNINESQNSLAVDFFFNF